MTDAWLMPNRQRVLPGRDPLPVEHVHARREGTFLVLAGTFAVAVAVTVLLAAPMIDLGATVEAWTGQGIGRSLHVPLGVLALPVTLAILGLVAELYGTRRAVALVSFGAFACLALTGLVGVTDHALGVSAAWGAAHLVGVAILATLPRRIWLRLLLSFLGAQLAGCAALAAFGWDVVSVAAYTTAVLVAVSLPLAAIARVLALYLRVGRDLEDLSAEDEPPILLDQRKRVRSPKPSLPPYSSAELRFFTEGDQLAEAE